MRITRNSFYLMKIANVNVFGDLQMKNKIKKKNTCKNTMPFDLNNLIKAKLRQNKKSEASINKQLHSFELSLIKIKRRNTEFVVSKIL